MREIIAIGYKNGESGMLVQFYAHNAMKWHLVFIPLPAESLQHTADSLMVPLCQEDLSNFF